MRHAFRTTFLETTLFPHCMLNDGFLQKIKELFFNDDTLLLLLLNKGWRHGLVYVLLLIVLIWLHSWMIQALSNPTMSTIAISTDVE